MGSSYVYLLGKVSLWEYYTSASYHGLLSVRLSRVSNIHFIWKEFKDKGVLGVVNV